MVLSIHRTMHSEIRVAIRRLVQAPAFALIAIATLALGIGANAAIFSVVEAVLLRPLPYAEPDRLVVPWQDYSRRGGPETEWFSPGNFFDWRASNRTLEGMAVFGDWGPTLVGTGNAERLAGGAVSHGFFRVLGVEPVLGRAFRAEDDLPGAAPTVLISHGLWQRLLGGRDSVLGSSIVLDGEPQVIVGVLPAGFDFPLIGGSEIFRPLRLDPVDAPRGSVFLRSVARLAPGVSLDQARQDLAAVAQRLEREYPQDNTGVGAHVTTLRQQLVGNLKPALLTLLGAVGLVLLIACVNLAGLLLVRFQGRSRERSVRRALGAGRWRLAAGVLAESTLLAGAGTAVGLMLAAWLVEGLYQLAPIPLPPAFRPTVNGTVIAFAIALAGVTAVLGALVPALSGGRADPARALREGGAGGGAGRRGHRLRSALVVGQVALAFTLLLVAGLLLRSFVELQRVDPGFDPGGVLTFRVAVPPSGYPEDPQVAAFYDRYLERLRASPGVDSVGMVSWMPMSGSDTDTSVVLEGEPAPEPGQAKVLWYRQVDPDYFRALGIDLVAGRTFTAGDSASAPRVVVLGEAAARRFFPQGEAVGKRLKPGGDPGADEPWWTVVGVVESVRHGGLDADPKLEMYLPHAQSPRRSMTVVVRSQGPPEAQVPAARAALGELDPTLSLAAVGTARELVSASVALPRLLTLCTLSFGLVALLLAALGIYGVVAQVVGRRTRELGIRIALGAERAAVLRLVMTQGGVLVAVGLVAGLAGAALAGRWVRGLLFQVAPADPGTWLGAIGLLAAAALLATWLPARRATHLDPLTALREG